MPLDAQRRIGFSRVLPSLPELRLRMDDRRRKRVPELPNWTHHDLRRTACSLMARVGVTDRVAEQVLGHAINGIEGIYNPS